jgi:glycine/serine hydroxymethyltransferase
MTEKTGIKFSRFKRVKTMKYAEIESISQVFKDHFGAVVHNFVMIIWGNSFQGKSNLCMQLVKFLVPHGKVLYLSLEEGLSVTLQTKVRQHLSELGEYERNVLFADYHLKFDKLREALRKKRSPKFILIDSLQYFGINYHQYKQLREEFPNKAFIFVSHANGKLPDGKTADRIKYDSDIKVRVDGYVAFIGSRFGGNKPYIIWEEGARKYWGKLFRKILNGEQVK